MISTLQLGGMGRPIKRGPSGGGTISGSHTHWRLYITEVETPGEYTAIQEIEMRGVAGGPDLCGSIGGIASSDFSGSHANRAFDGNLSDESTGAWTSSNTTKPQWIGYQFFPAVAVAEIAVWPQSRSDLVDRAPRDFEIQYSDDGTTWTTAVSYTGVTGWTDLTPKTFAVP